MENIANIYIVVQQPNLILEDEYNFNMYQNTLIWEY